MSMPKQKNEVMTFNAEKEKRKMGYIAAVGAAVAGASLVVTRIAASSSEDSKTVLAMNILSAFEAVGITVLAIVAFRSLQQANAERDKRMASAAAPTT